MAFHPGSKILLTLAAWLATSLVVEAVPVAKQTSGTSGSETVQYYQNRGYEPYYAPRMGPGNACQQRVGDYFRVPSNRVRELDTRVVDRGVYQISLSVQGRIVYCTVDARGNVLNIQ